jgi:hypothetical protein
VLSSRHTLCNGLKQLVWLVASQQYYTPGKGQRASGSRSRSSSNSSSRQQHQPGLLPGRCCAGLVWLARAAQNR